MDAACQSVSRVREGLGVALLLWPRANLLQPHALPDLRQDVVGVVVGVGGQHPQLGLPQVEAAPLEGGQHLVHGGARWRHSTGQFSRGKPMTFGHKQTNFNLFDTSVSLF